MLYRIAIENFFSIAEQQEINLLVPGNAPQLPCFRPSASIPDERLPVVAGFFGPNASGKSTILRAVVVAASFVRYSFALGVDAPIPIFQPYMRKDWWDRPSKIIIEFDCKLPEDLSPHLFRYELQIKHTTNAFGQAVAYEALSYAPKGKFRRIFEREGQKFSFGREFDIKDNDPRVQSIRPNASIVSTLAQLNHKLSIEFSSFINTMQTNIIGFDKAQSHANQLLPFYVQNLAYHKQLNRELRRLDVGLEEMLIEQGVQGLFAKFKHIGLDSFIFMNEESSGTKRFIEIFPSLQYVLETGSIALIDEIDTDLHPLLVPELFRWFADRDRNKHGAQLFFTAHNPALLDDLEKEQVFFTEKASGQATKVYGARHIKGLRREPSLMKKYLLGELGAVPHIG